jgi:hypothetical protein
MPARGPSSLMVVTRNTARAMFEPSTKLKGTRSAVVCMDILVFKRDNWFDLLFLFSLLPARRWQITQTIYPQRCFLGNSKNLIAVEYTAHSVRTRSSDTGIVDGGDQQGQRLKLSHTGPWDTTRARRNPDPHSESNFFHASAIFC